MSSLSAKSHRCSTCGAPLALERARDEILRCHYCGSDHRVVCAKAEAEAELRAERRVGAIAAPYFIGPILGFAVFFATRDALWSPYEGKPAMVVAAIFFLIGFMSFRVPAALGLAIVGFAGIAKPFLRPIVSSYGGELHEFSPTSETAFYYLVPGVISSIAAFLFFSSLKVRELGPASRALIPRPSMLVATALGVGLGYLVLGDTRLDLEKRNRALIDELGTLADDACEDRLPASLAPPLDPTPQFEKNGPGNILMVSCAGLKAPGKSGRDPLYLDSFSWFLEQRESRRPTLHMGATSWDEQRYERASATRYVIAYRGENNARVAIVADRATKTALVVDGEPLATDRQFFSALAHATGGSFPKGIGVGRTSGASAGRLAEQAPSVPISAEFELHSARTDSLGTLWFYGFVTNTSGIATDGPEVLVTLMDEEGRELRREHGYSKIPLEPGARGPIAVMVRKPPTYASHEFETVARRLSSVKFATNLVVGDATQSVSGKMLSFSGSVRNEGRSPAKFVSVHTMQFNESDELIGLRSTYAKAETLEAGAEARFLDKIYDWDPESMRIEHLVTGQAGRR